MSSERRSTPSTRCAARAELNDGPRNGCALWLRVCSPPPLSTLSSGGRATQDGGGSIDSKELKELMASVGQNPTDDELAEMIRIADADGTGEPRVRGRPGPCALPSAAPSLSVALRGGEAVMRRATRRSASHDAYLWRGAL